MAQPNSMETVVRTLACAGSSGETRVFCTWGADDHAAPDVDATPNGRRGFSSLVARLKSFAPDLIEHHQQVKQALCVQRALPDAAHLLYRHNALRPPHGIIDRWRYDDRYRRLDGLVFVSAAARLGFIEAFPHWAHKAFSVPNPIDARFWIASPLDRDPLIAFAGRPLPEKGLDLICAALPAVLEAHPDWRAVLMLNDWDKHAAWARAQLAPLEPYSDRIEILKSAPLAQEQEKMRRAAIAQTPSVWDEPFGLTAVEAHAAGAALITSGRGGLSEASGPHALYLDQLTPQALTLAMLQLIEDPVWRLALAEAAQAHVLA
ncbi:hypothetical protein LTR94_027988, partial [Friedmanniomyces endolithicus]